MTVTSTLALAALGPTPSSTLDLRGIREQIQLVASRITNNEYTEGDVATLFQVAEALTGTKLAPAVTPLQQRVIDAVSAPHVASTPGSYKAARGVMADISGQSGDV